MIKIILYILLAIILIALAAAGIHHYRVALKNARTMSAYEKEKITYNNNLGKDVFLFNNILILLNKFNINFIIAKFLPQSVKNLFILSFSTFYSIKSKMLRC